MTENSLEKLYRQYANEVYLYAFSLCKNHHDAQELVSDTFFKAMISLKQEDGKFKYWLFRVCKNSWLDGIKKNKYLLDKPIECFSISEKDVFIHIIMEEERCILYEAIQQLPQTYKEILILYYYCDIPLEVISEMMNISYSAGRMLISRARKRLKERLNKEDFI
jgi:RNA polymerase sigma-70 factor (ECF subfamily)